VSAQASTAVIGIAGDGHRLPVETDLEGIGPELGGNADVPRCFGTDLGGLRGPAVPECCEDAFLGLSTVRIMKKDMY